MFSLICPVCHREVSELLPDRCAGCIELDRAEAEVREEFGPVEVMEDRS